MMTDNKHQKPTFWAFQVKHSGYAIVEGGDGPTLLLLLHLLFRWPTEDNYGGC